MLARLMAGVNISIEVALLVEFIDIGVGVLVGTLAGFYGRLIDTFLARFTDVMFAFPGLLFAIILAATLGIQFSKVLGPPGRLILVSLALGIAVWPNMARFGRGQTLQLKEQQFVEAARTVGGTNRAIITRHVVPNLFSIVVAVATLNIVGTIVGEATISLLGLGIQYPGSSLGLMISDGESRIIFQPLEVLFPSAMLVLLVLCFAFVGDGVRDAFDPRTKD
jgi:peptide/nickel transport system permease protein